MALLDNNSEDLLCRTCLKGLSEGDADENPKHNIFQTPELAMKLIACTAAELEPSDHYPKHICNYCYSKVNEFYKFRIMCVESMERLRELSPASEDEEPMFDLGSIVKMEIVVGEHEVLFQDDDYTVGRGANAAASDMNSATIGKRVKSRANMKKVKVKDEDQMDGFRHFVENDKDNLLVFSNNKKPKGTNFRCDVCSAQFATERRLEAHKHAHETYVCDICGQQRSTLKELERHVNYHMQHTYPCKLCSRILSSPEKLRIHVRTVHEGIKKYACRYCDRKFGRWDTRKCHEMTHTGERPHKCEQCGKRFTQRGALKAHLKIHMRDSVLLGM